MQKFIVKAHTGHTAPWLTCILCAVLIAAMALIATGCEGGNTPADTSAGTATAGSPTATGDGNNTSENPETPIIKGEGNTVFTFTVTFADKTEKTYEIHTNKTVVGDALLELGLIAGDPGTYGLYVKSVDGVTADYDKDGTYWAFYVNGDYAMTGVDSTDITAGATYGFKVQK